MAKKKVNRVTATRRPRVPHDHMRVEVILPADTVKRITQHCERSTLDEQSFLKKAIYDALPVHYEVTKEFVFPFGKYAGEIAGVVKRIDPSYIDWCVRSITGFTLADDMIEAREEVSHEAMSSIYVPTMSGALTLNGFGEAPNMRVVTIDIEKVRRAFAMVLRDGEELRLSGNGNAWAYRTTAWGQAGRWRKLGRWALT